MSPTNILVFMLAAIDIVVGVLLLIGKVKLVIVYREEENPSTWPQELKEEEPVDTYVKPLEQVKPRVLVETPKRRRGRPRKALAEVIRPSSVL